MRTIERGPSTSTLWLPARLRRRLLEAARAARPREACGVLIGTAVAGHGRVADVVPLANRAADGRRSYRIEPVELEPILRTREVIGFYHSHPDIPAVFSARDAQLAWPGWWYVVIGTAAHGARLAAWRDGRTGRIASERRRENRWRK